MPTDNSTHDKRRRQSPSWYTSSPTLVSVPVANKTKQGELGKCWCTRTVPARDELYNYKIALLRSRCCVPSLTGHLASVDVKQHESI